MDNSKIQIMSSPRDLSDVELHQRLLGLKSKESQIVAVIITHLQEVYRRRLFADYGCSSIYDYCIRILGYSNGEAHRKISACKLMAQVPEIRERIASGEMSLSNAASVQALVARIQKSRQSLAGQIAPADLVKKDNSERDLFSSVADKVEYREAENEGLLPPHLVATAEVKAQVSQESCKGELGMPLLKTEAAPENFNDTLIKPLNSSAQNFELVRSIVERVKNKSSRECENELHHIAEEFNLQSDGPRPTRRNMNQQAQLKITVNRAKLDRLKHELGISCEQKLVDMLMSEKLEQLLAVRKSALKNEVKMVSHKSNSRPRSISSSKRAIVIKKGNGECENCGSNLNLQIDHKLCVAKGGGNDLDNLRLLCRSCNQRAAIKQLGVSKMEPYLTPSLAKNRKSAVS